MTHILIPRMPTMNLLRPFIQCPTPELDQAWAAMVRIAEVQHARAGSQCLAQIEEPARKVQATAPERIYLQGGPQLPPETDFAALSEVTWCRDDVDGTGIPYVRADLAGAAPAAAADTVRVADLIWAGDRFYGSDQWYSEEGVQQLIDAARKHAAAAPALEAPAAPAAPWCPDVCPITGRPFFMWIEHHKTGQYVPTYGGPHDSYTLPVKGSDGSFECERYDHDRGGWLTDEIQDLGLMIVDDQSFIVAPDHPRYNEVEEFANGAATFAAAKPGSMIAVPFDLIASACSAIDKKRDAPKTLAELRRYTTGDLSCAALAAAPQAPAAPSGMPSGWVPCILTHDGQHPEEVAYGPQIMMDRLKKWLSRYFELLAHKVLAEPVQAEMLAALQAVATDVVHVGAGENTISDAARAKVEAVLEKIGAPWPSPVAAPAAPAVDASDTERMDWLETQVVNVRAPLRYGSRDLFWASPEEVDGGPDGPSDLRARIDAAQAAAKGTP